MRYTKHIILISILIILGAFFANVDSASAKLCIDDKDCGSYQSCKDVPQTNVDPNIKTTTRTCVDSCPPKERAAADNYCPNPPEDKNFTCVNYTCIAIEQPLPPVPGTQITGLDTYIKYVYQIALGVVGLMALIVLIIGGVMYMTAAGNASQMSEAKDRIQNAILGLIMALAAYLILYTINPDLVRLKPVQLSYPSMPKVILSCENNICKAKTITPQDITPDTQSTCGEVGTECPPSCKIISASLEPDIVKAPANAESVTETVKGIIKLRGKCEDNINLIITSFESKVKIPDLLFDFGNKIGEKSIKDMSSARFQKGFPYDTWTFDFQVGKVLRSYWFTATLTEKWNDSKTNTEKVYSEGIKSTPVAVRK